MGSHRWSHHAVWGLGRDVPDQLGVGAAWCAGGGWVGVGVQFKAVKGGEGSKTAARFFASGVGSAAEAVIRA